MQIQELGFREVHFSLFQMNLGFIFSFCLFLGQERSAPVGFRGQLTALSVEERK